MGAIGWNIVTGYLDSAARGMGFDTQMAHDDRYDLAEEYMQVVYALWEGSWEDDAVVMIALPAFMPIRRACIGCNTKGGNTARRRSICASRRRNERRCCIRPARRIAAAPSPRGMRNACSSTAAARPMSRAWWPTCGPRATPRPVQVFVGATVVVGRTEREAQDKLAEYRRHASVEGALAHAAASLGIDFAKFDMDEPIDGSASQAIQSNVEAMARAIGPGWTKRQLTERFVLGSRQLPITGDPQQVADALLAWVTEGDVDGFNLSRTVVPECLDDFIDLVVPVLQERGVYKGDYTRGTYREKLFGSARLAAPHPAAEFRRL